MPGPNSGALVAGSIALGGLRWQASEPGQCLFFDEVFDEVKVVLLSVLEQVFERQPNGPRMAGMRYWFA